MSARLSFRWLLLGVSLALPLVGAASAHAGEPAGPPTAPSRDEERGKLQRHVVIAANAGRVLASIARDAAPNDLDADQRKGWDEQSSWLAKTAAKFEALRERMQGLLDRDARERANDIVSKMAQMNMQFLALQEATQMESRRFQTLSNASRARDDLARSAIRGTGDKAM